MLSQRAIRMLLLASIAGVAVSRAAPLDQPTPETLTEASRIVQEMIASQRGPYRRILWFCNDGTTQPPVAYACRDHGGGRQHAEYSPARHRLAELGWSVGTIFADLSPAELLDSQPRRGRLRELPLERYLVDIDDGWVLRHAQGYRGRVQVEDEDAAGRALLLDLLRDTAWADENFLLVRESARTIPHGNDSDIARRVRRAAIELAELDPAAERWRAEIHARPSAGTSGRLRRWLADVRQPEVVALGEQIAADLDLLFGEAGRRERLSAALAGLGRSAAGREWRQVVDVALATDGDERVRTVCDALTEARSSVFPALAPAGRLALLDAMQGLEIEVQLADADGPDESRTRRDLLAQARALLTCAYASGLLSTTERDALRSTLVAGDAAEMPLSEYLDAVRQLKRAPGWATGTIRYTFAEPLIRYTALDARAARFADDLLRGSPMWMLGPVLKALSRDADRLAGSIVDIDGQVVGTAVALNGGLATGRLRIFPTIDSIEHAEFEATDIVVLPETIAELQPVAGILTLGEGNALSHVQLLARNFGIPNVAIDQETVDLLSPLEGERVLFVVGDGGNVVLRRLDEVTEPLLATQAAVTDEPTSLVRVPVPNLDDDDLLPLPAIGRELSGILVGPKAANLGELNRLFPGRVAPGIALPFGVYAAHLDEAGLRDRIAAAFAARADGSLDATAFNAELADVRSRIASLALAADFREELVSAMAADFGEPGTYGVFIRSDTNVEDLPQFTGAGLNETIPNVVGLEAQLAGIPKVWSSVLSPRALAWRASVLANPEQIYASVLLMKSVPSTKSGVLVTANLVDRNAPGLTTSVAWGVGGAVAGEAAASLLIEDDRVELLSEAKSAYQRALADTGGVTWVPASAGRVLSDAEIEQLRALAVEVRQKYVPVMDESGNPRPWDIEFGFVDGSLTLFQIRPLVERANRSAEQLLRRLRLDARTPEATDAMIDLRAIPGEVSR